jgi:type I site-specific restriction endonuclease
MNKKSLSERAICTKFITPALESAGWAKSTPTLRRNLHRLAPLQIQQKQLLPRYAKNARSNEKRAQRIPSA